MLKGISHDAAARVRSCDTWLDWGHENCTVGYFHVPGEGARKAFVNIVARKSRCSSREVATASLKENYVCEKKSAIKSHHTGRQWVRNSSNVWDVYGLGTVLTFTVTVLQEQTAIECLKLPGFDKQYCRLVWWRETINWLWYGLYCRKATFYYTCTVIGELKIVFMGCFI